MVRLRLPEALPLLPGDRFVLRESGRQETVGGGEVLDVDPVLPAARARPSRSVDRVVAERGWVEVDLLHRLTGERREPTIGTWVTTEDEIAAARDRIEAQVAEAGPLGLDLAGLDDQERAVLETLDGIEVVGTRARVAGQVDPLADHAFVAALAAEPFAPPGPEEVDPGELAELVRRGDIVESEGHYYAASAIELAASRLSTMLADQPDGVTVSEVRDELATSRKHVLPILAVLDGTGVTRRRGDVRIGGPRLPDAPD